MQVQKRAWRHHLWVVVQCRQSSFPQANQNALSYYLYTVGFMATCNNLLNLYLMLDFLFAGQTITVVFQKLWILTGWTRKCKNLIMLFSQIGQTIYWVIASSTCGFHNTIHVIGCVGMYKYTSGLRDKYSWLHRRYFTHKHTQWHTQPCMSLHVVIVKCAICNIWWHLWTCTVCSTVITVYQLSC